MIAGLESFLGRKNNLNLLKYEKVIGEELIEK